MAKQIPRANDVYSLLLDLIFTLSPRQAQDLLAELSPRYNKRMMTRLYDRDGNEDKETGKIRLTPYQYKTIRTKYGDTFLHKGFKELTNYIEYLEQNAKYDKGYAQKLKQYSTKTHWGVLSPGGWVYEKCKSYIQQDRPEVPVNPYLINDFEVAKAYIMSLPKPIIADAMDVKMLILKFPELAELVRQ